MESLKQYSGKTGVSRPMILLALLALLALLTWLLWPVRVTMEGSGTVQPHFENLVQVTPGESGMVCRVMVERFQDVRAGEPLFEYIPAGKFSVLSYVIMIPPGGAKTESEPVSALVHQVEQKRIARIEAATRWSSQVLKQVINALKWESDLAKWLTMSIPREADLMQEQAWQRENVRLGSENANKVYTFNKAIGESVATEQGIPFASPATGTLYSLWVQPRMQIFGSPVATLPPPTPGSPPMMALYAADSSPVAEIMLPGTPLEVLALIPVPPRSLHRLEGWQVSLIKEGQKIAIPEEVTKVEIGRVSISPTDARLIAPELSVSEESVFVRLSLGENTPWKIGKVVRVRLVSPLRPRAWFWLRGIWDNDNGT